nr:hypothetical protein HUO10_000588 [Paraburkholderia busanensis]
MSTDIAASLNEHQRDALLAFYLGQYVPNSTSPDLATLVQTPEDVYEYLLIDPLVSNAVPTSQVAQAISSIQQYINGITLNMEPGYDTQYLDPDQLNQWTGGASQYNFWGGEVELDTYPEDYIDPTLRQSKTEYFIELESSLDQHAINKDNAQQAVLGYLNEFEKVANLDVISGYLAGSDQTRNTYYMLGRTRETSPQYYWRSLDMSLNNENVMSTGAWTQWYAMNTAINADALMGLPRLTYFNNRLYLFWFEKTASGKDINIASDSGGTVSTTSAAYQTISAYSSYCDFSNTWSTPNLLAAIDSAATEDEEVVYCTSLFSATPDALYTVAVYYESEDKLLLSLYSDATSESSPGITGYSDFTLQIDYWFNASVIKSKSSGKDLTDVAMLLEHFSSDEQQRVQLMYATRMFTVDKVGPVSNYQDDFSEEAQKHLPPLDVENFLVTNNDDGSLQLLITIPATFDTSLFRTSDITNIAISSTESFPAGGGTVNGEIHIDDDVVVFYKMIISNTDYTGEYSRFTYKIGCKDSTISTTNDGNRTITVNSNPTYDIASSEFEIDDNTISTGLLFYNDAGQLADNPWAKFSFKTTFWTFTVKNGTWLDGSTIQTIGPTPEFLPDDAPFTTTIPIEKPESTSLTITVSFGYATDDNRVVYQTYPITLVNSAEIKTTPYISTRSDDKLGTAQYLDFQSATFESGTLIDDIRLNTLFAKNLINQANLSLDALLGWDTQWTMEPGMKDATPIPMDFHGANGIYFWELFFYMPHLVAWRLNQEQKYSDAKSWYHYIFDPAARGRQNRNQEYPEPDYWSVRPLVEPPATGAQGTVGQLTTDPDAIASANPVHYQKAVFMAYVGNLIASADASYRLLTNDGLSLAKLQYAQARDLLGQRPDVSIYSDWTPRPLSALADSTWQSTALRDFEQNLSAGNLPLFPGRYAFTQTVGTNDAFIAPLNKQLLQYWNLVDSRMYNLRHNLSIDGLPINVPLYAAPVDPWTLTSQSVQGGALASAANGVIATIPPFRFRGMWQNASTAASFLSQLGQTLLSYCERGDTAALQELDQQQLLTISAFTVSLQQNAIDALAKDRDALTASETLTQHRLDYYQGLYDEGVSTQEQQALSKMQESENETTAAMSLMISGCALNMAPNIFGFSDGGSVWGAALEGSSGATGMQAQVAATEAQKMQTSAEYARRQDEWNFQISQAQDDLNAISKQLDALSVRQQGARTSLAMAQAQQTNLQSTLTFLTSRFTQSSLYNWLTGQLSSLYYQAYDAVLSLCLSTEACWQYEMGDVMTRFIQTNAWNDSYRGFLVGETLQLNLQQMQSAWLARNVRRLELTKTISLKQLIDDDDIWNDFISTGKVDFTLTEALFDADYPGHYLRQLNLVTVTLPALLGPYQDVRLTLTQTSSSVLLKADIDGVKYLNDSKTGSAANIMINPRANQQVAISSGLNDSGLFALNFGDERYLPFEGTGAVSRWHVSFPNPTSNEQTALLASLNDVIVQVHYTALYGGTAFESAVSDLA